MILSIIRLIFFFNPSINFNFHYFRYQFWDLFTFNVQWILFLLAVLDGATLEEIHEQLDGHQKLVDGHTIEYAINQKGSLSLLIDGYPFNRVLSAKKTYYHCVHAYTLG